MNYEKSSSLMTGKLILFFVISTKGHITKTQLVKFLYLADLYATKWTGKQITNLDWYFYNHGPWQEDIQVCLDYMNGRQIKITQGKGSAILIKPGVDIPELSELQLPKSMKLVLDNIRREWSGSGTKKFDGLMEYVYNTAPMKDLTKRGYTSKDKRRLDLSLATKQLKHELSLCNAD